LEKGRGPDKKPRKKRTNKWAGYKEYAAKMKKKYPNELESKLIDRMGLDMKHPGEIERGYQNDQKVYDVEDLKKLTDKDLKLLHREIFVSS